MAGPTAANEVPERHDLTDLLDALHEELDLERTTAGDHVNGDPVNAPLTDPRDLERPRPASGPVIESTGGLHFDPDFASFAARFGAAMIDGIVLTAAMVPGLILLVIGTTVPVRLVGLALLIVAFAFVNVWYARSVAASGQWLGNRVTRTTVVDGLNGSFVDFNRAGARFTVRHLISPILLLGFIVALTDSQRRTFHDRVVTTVVIRPTRASWSVDDHRDD